MKSKSLIVPTIYLLIIFSLVVGLYFTRKAYLEFNVEDEDITYVSQSIFTKTIPVVDVKDVFSEPFENEDVAIGRYFYDTNGTIEEQSKALVFYQNTYMPNTGIDYVLEEKFEVINVYNGTVIDITDDELLGKSVSVRHNNELISVYQGLSEVNVVNGDLVPIGSKIGLSGTSKLNNSLGNHLHFEIYKNGEVINPLLCIGKEMGDF